jgi:carbonic anhydrase
MRDVSAVVLVALSLGLVGCGRGDDVDHGGGAAWSYSPGTGPDRWAELDRNYALCGEGTEQSPIDLSAAVAPDDEPPLDIDYRPTPLVIINNGHTIEVEYRAGSTLTVGGQTWGVRQFHFHAHSEHTVGGAASPLELHVVHRDDAGNLAVVGVFIEEGAANAALATVFDRLPAQKGARIELEGVEVNAADLLPADLAAWRYDGSLTTPPCSEGVRWHVLANPIKASPQQIAAFKAIFADNHRAVQPLNDRILD